MKIRNGFVSNSSSSSFVVSFDKVPKSKTELCQMLFGDQTEYHSPYDTDYFAVDDVVDIVWYDMTENGPATIDQIKETMQGVHMYNDISRTVGQINDWVNMPTDFDSNWNKSWDNYWNQFHILIDKKAVDEKRTFVFEYSDNDGDLYSAMEHGNLFQNIPNVITTSHH